MKALHGGATYRTVSEYRQRYLLHAIKQLEGT